MQPTSDTESDNAPGQPSDPSRSNAKNPASTTKKQYKRKLTAERRMQNKLHQKLLRERRRDALTAMASDLQPAPDKLEV
ncbi:UNVERIFIED_CONTAM: hypothetical protein HDU68_001413 [Siphonaria sp. JEL0065]|nr:hypothetical protein HDU68_001413 [Siphonaria sp. JEL0065]